MLEIGGETLVLTHDMMVEGVHWLPGTDEADIAHKLVASNLSDLAAKGAEPVGALCGFTLGDDIYNARFAHWLGRALARWNVPLLGGDTVASPTRMAGLTLIGRATTVPVPSRAGARPGDAVFVAGFVGDAMFGHGSLKGAVASVFMKNNTAVHLEPYFIDRFLRPMPLLDEGRALAPLVSAMMDVSDGLLLDATRMAEASGVTFALDFAAMPFSPEFLAALDGNQLDVMTDFRLTKDAALRWGDDYALLFTAPAGTELPVAARRIGTVQARGPVPLLIDGAPPSDPDALGYRHG